MGSKGWHLVCIIIIYVRSDIFRSLVTFMTWKIEDALLFTWCKGVSLGDQIKLIEGGREE